MSAKRPGIKAVTTSPAASSEAQEVLPKPEEAFKDAKIGRTYKDSTPGTISLTKAPAGAPNGSPVSEDYQAPFAYGGTIKTIKINVQPSGLNASDRQKVRDGERAVALGIE